MAFDLLNPDDYGQLVEKMTAMADDIAGAAAFHDGLTVHLWLQSIRASDVAYELADLDLQARRLAASWARHLFGARSSAGGDPSGALGPLAFDAAPIPPEAGGFEVLRADQGASLQIDMETVGLVLGMLVDAPAAFFLARAILRASPVRIAWRRKPKDGKAEDRTVDVVHGDTQVESIRAERLKKRTILRDPTGSELIEEEYYPPSIGVGV